LKIKIIPYKICEADYKIRLVISNLILNFNTVSKHNVENYLVLISVKLQSEVAENKSE